MECVPVALLYVFWMLKLAGSVRLVVCSWPDSLILATLTEILSPVLANSPTEPAMVKVFVPKSRLGRLLSSKTRVAVDPEALIWSLPRRAEGVTLEPA